MSEQKIDGDCALGLVISLTANAVSLVSNGERNFKEIIDLLTVLQAFKDRQLGDKVVILSTRRKIRGVRRSIRKKAKKL